MAQYILRRLTRALITLLVFQTILFLLIHSVRWDAVNLFPVPAGVQDAVRHLLGLDLPLWKQYLVWMKGFFSGNLGRSFQLGGVPVARLFIERLLRTLLLFLPGTLVGFSLGLWLGKHIAWKRGGTFELGDTLAGRTGIGRGGQSPAPQALLVKLNTSLGD